MKLLPYKSLDIFLSQNFRMIVHDFSQVARLPRMRLLNRDLLLDIISVMADALGEIRNTKHDLTTISIHSDI